MAATRELAGSLVVDENEAAAVVLKCPVTRKDGDDEAAMLELAERRPRDPRGLNGSTELRWEEEEEEKEEKAAAGATGVRTKSAKPQKCEQAAGDIGRLRPPESLPVTPRLPASRPHSTGSDSEVVVPPCSGKAQRTRPRSGTRAAVVASDGCGVDEEPPTVANGGCRAATEARNDGGRPVSVDPPEPDSPDPSASSEPSDDTSLSEEEEEACAGSDRVVRPHTLRTKPNLCVSLSCDATPLSPADADEGGFSFEKRSDLRGVFEAGRRKSAPEADLRAQANCDETALTHKRNLFPRRAKESALPPSHNAPGWRLFGKARLDAKEEEGKGGELASSPTEQVSPQRPPTAGRRKNLDFEPLSTTALILEDRPPNLPAKSEEETQRHKLEYEEMVAGAKRRELKDAQKKKRQMKERHRHEDSISSAMVVWNTHILPHWDAVKGTRRVRELWWQGLPPSVRGRVWRLAIGNELNITAELYDIFLCRAKEKWRSYSETSSVNNDTESDGGASLADRESSLDLIKLDISRTFPSLFIFQKGGPYHDVLHSVLGAYTCYRPDIGYVQGMSFIAAVLILNLEEADAFVTFANLLNKPCQMAFFRVDHDLMLKYFAAFEVFFEENLPRLFGHFRTNKLTPDLYLIDWIFTLYSKSLPLDVACRVWDVFCRDGEESLFRTGLGILRLFQDVLLQMDFIHIAQFLSRLPEDLQAHALFAAMAATHMISRNRRWAQVFSSLAKDKTNETADTSGSPALRS
ncbi:TBC1 domain family member 12-like isoform X2 [Phyllopteryx taeniolatus]|uniref:TBC1 domain family member 12-like isoform X2 n=1 Tax=Phyllopteryx taeniolatus TaxID=161469 RepID=UPI002AD59584|nr:TBC1 domain family member 12-like isoform X2 [Phyllopteryx taeniolatus]